MNAMQVTAIKSAILTPASQPVVTAAAYSAGHAVGTGVMSFANMSRDGLNSGLITSVRLAFKSIQTTQFDVIFFSANPSGSTLTDRNAANIVAADLSLIIGIAALTAYAGFSATSVAEAKGLNIPFNVDTVYAAIVARSTPTFGSTSDVIASISVQKD